MEPMTRSELFMATAAGEYSGELPEPVTRSEFYWQKIAQRIDEGSSVSPEAIDAAIEDYLNTHDADMVTEAELSDALLGKAAASHTHAQSEVTGLESALSGKANASHTHAQSDVTGLESALSGKANASHTHTQSDVTGLETALLGKAAASHTHTKSQITDLANATTSADGLMSKDDKTKLDACKKIVVCNSESDYISLTKDSDTVYMILEETT